MKNAVQVIGIVVISLSAFAVEESPAPPVVQVPAAILERKIDVVYRRDYLSEVLTDLDRRVGLRVGYPKALEESFLISLEEKQLTVKQVLEKIAAASGLELEFSGDEAFFSKKADDNTFTELAGKLKDGDVEKRCKALSALSQLSDQRIYPLMFKALEDLDARVVETAVVELYWSYVGCFRQSPETQAAAAALLKLFGTGKGTSCRIETIELLGRMRASQAAGALVAVARDSNEKEYIPLSPLRGGDMVGIPRERAIHALAQIRGGRATEALNELLKDPDLKIRIHTASALCYTLDRQALERVLALVKDSWPEQQLALFDAVRKPWDSSAIDLLVQLLKSPDKSLRVIASVGLEQTRQHRAVETLLASLKDPDDAVQREAAYTLGPMCVETCETYVLREPWDPADLENCIALLKDADENVRDGALIALSSSRDLRAVDTFIALTKDPDARVRSRAAQALCHTRDPRVVELLINLLKDADGDVRRWAANSLSLTRDPRALEPLLALLKEADEDSQSAAADALFRIPDPRAQAAYEQYDKKRAAAMQQPQPEPAPVKPPPAPAGDF
jgi:HEAT repeat protein